MTREIPPVEVQVDELVREVVLKALEVAGGLRRLVEYRNLTWVPALIEAAYAVVLHEEFHQSEDAIAQFLGVSSTTVRNILRAVPEGVQERLEAERGKRTLRTHIAGALAKLAYRQIKAGTRDT
jgi:probable regulatory domain-containing protein